MTVLSSSWCKQTVNCTDDECHKKGYVNNINFTTFFLASFKYNFEMKSCVSFTRSVLCGKLLAVEEDILYSIAKYKQGIVYTSEVVIGKPFFTVHLTLFFTFKSKSTMFRAQKNRGANGCSQIITFTSYFQTSLKGGVFKIQKRYSMF